MARGTSIPSAIRVLTEELAGLLDCLSCCRSCHLHGFWFGSARHAQSIALPFVGSSSLILSVLIMVSTCSLFSLPPSLLEFKARGYSVAHVGICVAFPAEGSVGIPRHIAVILGARAAEA